MDAAAGLFMNYRNLYDCATCASDTPCTNLPRVRVRACVCARVYECVCARVRVCLVLPVCVAADGFMAPARCQRRLHSVGPCVVERQHFLVTFLPPALPPEITLEEVCQPSEAAPRGLTPV